MQEFTVKNPDFRELVREKLKKQYFMTHLGIQLTLVEPGEVEAIMDSQTFLQQQSGFLHGGVSATLCDVSAGFAAFTLVAKDEMVVTGDLHVSYLNPGDAPKYLARGWVIKTGKLLHFCESEVWGIYPDGRKVFVAKSSATMITIKLKAIEPK